MEAELAPALVGFVLLDDDWRVLSANREAVSALQAAQTIPSKSEQDLLQAFAAEVARRMQNQKPPKTFSYAGCTCTVLQFSCKYGSAAEEIHAALIRPAREDPSFLATFSRMFHLSPRESEALALCLKGKGAKEIATDMGISVSTAKSFLRLTSIKMGVTSRAEILSKVLDSMCEASMTCPFRPRRG